MIDSFKELRDLLDRQARHRMPPLLGMILIMGFMESLGVGSIVPFVAVLTHPGVVESNRYLASVYSWLAFGSPTEFLFFLGVVAFGMMISSLIFKALTSWAVLRFTLRQKYKLSRRLFERYLHQPYEWFLERHSATLGRTILSEVNEVVSGSLTPAMRLVTQVAVVFFLVAMLIAADPLLAITVSVFVGGTYGLIFWLTRRYVSRIGSQRVHANRERFRIASEALTGIKDVKVLNIEDTFLRRFDKPSRQLADFAATSQIIRQVPQFALQGIALSSVMLIVLYQLHMRGSVDQSLPIIALYALAGQRLLPAFQQVYASISSMRFTKPALDLLHRDLGLAIERPNVEAEPPLNLQHQFELRDVSYCYPTAASPALRNVSLVIPARSMVGLVGQTGAGKTTVVDIILGLLEPQHGQLTVDRMPIDRQNRPSWQRRLGYVPQHIFLADDSVAANIAFGVEPDGIDMEAVERASRIANLHEFVTAELEHGYETQIGERGVRLSGGQRQRVGIARALYRDPDVIIMDEATSALDNVTERAVMEAVRNLAHRKTIILIAHRLTTVKRCDIIFLMEKGRVVASGTYEELAVGSESFRAMVNSVGG